MTINEQFIHTKATVVGATHVNNFKNNQDFHWVIHDENTLIALVADGCGSGAHSEVGAGLIIPFLARELMYNLNSGTSIEKALEKSLQLTKEKIHDSVAGMVTLQINPAEVIENFFLFTIVGTIVTEKETIVFSLGDGVYVVNGSIHVIDQNNAPNYLSYTVLNGKEPEFAINVKMPTETVESIIIASDGAVDLIKNKDQQVKVGLQMKQVGDITQFVEEPSRGSSVKMKKHLNVLSKQNILSDDTTIVTIVRKTPEGE